MSVPDKPHILVADDDESVRELVSRWLERAGYSVSKARDGEQVTEAVQKALPAAIVMDLTMPRMDGFAVLTKFRELGLPRVPVLMLTGRVSADDVRKAVLLGAKDYLAKPVDRDQLLARMDRMLRKYGEPPPGDAPPEGAQGPDQYLD